MPISRKISFTFIASSLLLLFTACDFGPSTTPQEHIDKAKNFFAEGKANEGMIELKNALQQESNLPEARWLLGKIYLQAGNGAAAFKEISQAQSLGFTDPELSKFLLQAMLLQGKNQEILDQTYTDDVMSADTLLLRGNAHLGLKEFDEARSTFNKLLEQDSSSVGARKGLIRVALSVNELDEAGKIIEETLSFALEDAEVWILKGQLAFQQNAPEKAEEAFARVISIDDTNVAAQLGLARALLIQNKVEDALAPIAAVESLYPNLPLVKYYRGYIALINNETDKAKDLLLGVISVMPNHPETLLLLSRIYYDEGQLAQAETHISNFLSSFPTHLPALKLLSVIQLKQKQPGASIETLSDAASQAQGDWQVLALLGSALMENGDLEKGIELLEQATQINPDTAAIHTQLAIGHLVSGSMDSAVSELESAIELDPELIRADILLILAHLKSNKIDAAITAAKSLVEKHPDNPLSYNLLGAAYIGKGDSETAKKQFDQALTLKADFTPAIANLARLDIQKGDLDEAERKFNKVLELDENNADALENLARLEGQRGNVKKLVALLEQARATNPSALNPRLVLARYYAGNQKARKFLEVITEAHNLSPSHPEVSLLLGQAYRVNGNYEESISTLKSLLQLAPESQETLFQLGLAQAQSGKADVAKENLGKILATDKNHLGALLASARIALGEKDYTSANDFVSKIKQSKNNMVDAYVLEGDIQLTQGKHSEAIASYQKAFAEVQNAAVIIKLAQAYNLSGDETKAKSTLNDWLKEHPEDEASSLFLASLYQSSNNEQPAIEKYEKILEMNPNNVIALNNLAWLYLNANPARALKLAKKANQQVPNSPEIMDTLGWVLIKQGNIEEGLAFLGPAREAAPKLPGIRYRYAEALHAAGDNGRARSEVKILLEEFQQFDERNDAETLLNKLK